MSDWQNQVSAVLIGLLIGLLVGRLTRTLVALIALGGLIVGALTVMGKGQLVADLDILPNATSLALQLIGALRQVLITMPAAVMGSLAGLALHEVVRVVKSR